MAMLVMACQPATPPPDVVILGHVHTMNPAQPRAGVLQCVTVDSSLWVTAATFPLRDSNTHVIDLQNATAYS